jgi:hypothetical protein
MGALRDMLAKARLRYAEDGGSILAILDWAADNDGELVADALLELDRCTPHPWTFSLYVCGAYWTEEGDIAYRAGRSRVEILAVMGKACQRAVRAMETA